MPKAVAPSNKRPTNISVRSAKREAAFQISTLLPCTLRISITAPIFMAGSITEIRNAKARGERGESRGAEITGGNAGMN